MSRDSRAPPSAVAAAVAAAARRRGAGSIPILLVKGAGNSSRADGAACAPPFVGCRQSWRPSATKGEARPVVACAVGASCAASAASAAAAHARPASRQTGAEQTADLGAHVCRHISLLAARTRSRLAPCDSLSAGESSASWLSRFPRSSSSRRRRLSLPLWQRGEQTHLAACARVCVCESSLLPSCYNFGPVVSASRWESNCTDDEAFVWQAAAACVCVLVQAAAAAGRLSPRRRRRGGRRRTSERTRAAARGFVRSRLGRHSLAWLPFPLAPAAPATAAAAAAAQQSNAAAAAARHKISFGNSAADAAAAAATGERGFSSVSCVRFRSLFLFFVFSPCRLHRRRRRRRRRCRRRRRIGRCAQRDRKESSSHHLAIDNTHKHKHTYFVDVVFFISPSQFASASSLLL